MILILSGIIPLIYVFYTGHIWEDYFITFKFSRNLVEGRGLVYNPGQRVHGFTSPLGVLLPALTYLVTGSDLGAIWLFRILFAVPAFVAGAYFMIKSSEILFKDFAFATYFCVLFYMLDPKGLMFAVNGMETALMLFFISWMIYIVVSGMDGKYLQMGLAWAGLMWTRPDSCVYIGAFIISSLLFLNYVSRKSQVKLFLKAAVICALIYLPWFVWAWIYYGSPVPHTVIAKGAQSQGHEVISSIILLFQNLPTVVGWVYAPAYPHFGPFPFAIGVFSFVCGLAAVLLFIIPGKIDRTVRFMSFFFFIILCYFSWMWFPFPWYFPPLSIIGIPVIGYAVIKLSERLNLRLVFRVAIFASLLICVFVLLILESLRMKAQMEIIEKGNRQAIGEWLSSKAASPEETAYMECIGYIGYYSGLRILDWPGLVSPSVVEAVKNRNANFVSAVAILKPDWVVARGFEAQKLMENEFFSQNYVEEKIFDVRPEIYKRKNLIGSSYLLYDSVFCLFRRKK